mgnify:CR=1 FL=1
MNPSTTGFPAHAEASASFSASAAVEAGGFSMKTGKPFASAAIPTSKCAAGPAATIRMRPRPSWPRTTTTAPRDAAALTNAAPRRNAAFILRGSPLTPSLPPWKRSHDDPTDKEAVMDEVVTVVLMMVAMLIAVGMPLAGSLSSRSH